MDGLKVSIYWLIARPETFFLLSHRSVSSVDYECYILEIKTCFRTKLQLCLKYLSEHLNTLLKSCVARTFKRQTNWKRNLFSPPDGRSSGATAMEQVRLMIPRTELFRLCAWPPVRVPRRPEFTPPSRWPLDRRWRPATFWMYFKRLLTGINRAGIIHVILAEAR